MNGEAKLNEDGESRALTLIAAPPRRPAAILCRDPQFLAHLIATRTQAPQTRSRRRAEPAEAVAAYQRQQGLASA